MEYKIRIINKRLGLSGTNIAFTEKEFFGLKVNECVTQIGNGKENGCIRTDQFIKPIKYVGSIIYMFNIPEEMFAFMLPDQIDNENIYLLYGSTGAEIFTEGYYARHRKKITSYVRFYKPVFVRVNH